MKKSSIAWLVLIFFCFYALKADVQNHEAVHKQIFSDFGIDSVVEDGWITGSTRPTNGSQILNLNKADFRLMNEEHIINEAVDYNLVGIRSLLLMLVVMYGYGFCIKVFGNEEFGGGRIWKRWD